MIGQFGGTEMENNNFDPAKELERVDTYRVDTHKKTTVYQDNKHKEDLRPKYYKGKDGQDLFSRFENGLLSKEQVRGFYLGNIIKYITRYRGKNGVEDLLKADTYLNRLIEFEEHEEETE